MRAKRRTLIQCISLMKNKIPKLAVLFLSVFLTTTIAQAKSAIVGDIILLGNVERSGRLLLNDASIFEGDSIRTQKASSGILRIATGRVEIGESSEVEILRQNPLTL